MKISTINSPDRSVSSVYKNMRVNFSSSLLSCPRSVRSLCLRFSYDNHVHSARKRLQEGHCFPVIDIHKAVAVRLWGETEVWLTGRKEDFRIFFQLHKFACFSGFQVCLCRPCFMEPQKRVKYFFDKRQKPPKTSVKTVFKLFKMHVNKVHGNTAVKSFAVFCADGRIPGGFYLRAEESWMPVLQVGPLSQIYPEITRYGKYYYF